MVTPMDSEINKNRNLMLVPGPPAHERSQGPQHFFAGVSRLVRGRTSGMRRGVEGFANVAGQWDAKTGTKAAGPFPSSLYRPSQQNPDSLPESSGHSGSDGPLAARRAAIKETSGQAPSFLVTSASGEPHGVPGQKRFREKALFPDKEIRPIRFMDHGRDHEHPQPNPHLSSHDLNRHDLHRFWKKRTAGPGKLQAAII